MIDANFVQVKLSVKVAPKICKESYEFVLKELSKRTKVENRVLKINMSFGSCEAYSRTISRLITVCSLLCILGVDSWISIWQNSTRIDLGQLCREG
jgi:hypothetical protein